MSCNLALADKSNNRVAAYLLKPTSNAAGAVRKAVNSGRRCPNEKNLNEGTFARTSNLKIGSDLA
jgi:hypothetical protein